MTRGSLVGLASPRQPDAGLRGLGFRRCHDSRLHRPVPRRMRLVMLMLAVYLAPLPTAPLFHLDRFDPAAPITYAFFALVLP